MKNRDYKKFGMGEYYHIYNRGNEKKEIFREQDDFRFFLERMTKYLLPEKFKQRVRELLPNNTFSLISYCLMPNHFHLLIRQNTELPVTALMRRLGTSYSMYFNRKYQRVGGVFQDQYKMVLVDDNRYLIWLSAYIHQNPKVANLASNLKDYPWSSYNEFLGQSTLAICDKNIILQQFANLDEYSNFLKESYSLIKHKKDIESLLIDN